MVEYYSQRASAGLIVTESTMILPGDDGFGPKPGIYNHAQVDGWRKVTNAVHAAKGHIFLQLWHPGRTAHPFPEAEMPPVSSTDKPIQDTFETPEGLRNYPTPRALLKEELPGIVDLFYKGAKNALEAGFDGVEIHGAHGYLLDQFLRNSVNQRKDDYGGMIENRSRLALEVVDAAIDIFGASRVGIRVSPLVTYNEISDSDPAGLVAHLSTELERRGVAFLDLRHHRHDDPAEEELARICRRNYHGCLIRNGGFTRETGEAAIRDGLADAIAYGVPFIGNPDLVSRFEKNAPLNPSDSDTFYSQGAKGYTDYPTLAEQRR